MTTRFATATRRLAALATLSTALAAPRVWADIISYSATSFTNTASLGGTTLDSCPAGNPVCVEVTVYFLADTANIVPFSVPGASGFENFTGSGRVQLFNDQTGDLLTANFDPNTIFVSVDQTNGGVGFGSASGGPTYPLGVYGGTPSIPYASYDLRSAMTVSGFAWFCPPGTCTLGVAGPDLATDQGALSITPVGPVLGSSFSATVIQVTNPVPEPSSLVLLAVAMTGIVFRVAGKSPLGILRRR